VSLSWQQGSGEQIGDRLRRLRIEQGLSQRDLAGPGVSYTYVSRIENGTRVPSVKALRRLAEKLGVSVEYLETGDDLGEADQRELRLGDAELTMRLGDAADAEPELTRIYVEARSGGDDAVAARALIAQALILGERGEHSATVSMLEHAFALDPPSLVDRIDPYVALGRGYCALGRTERAIELYERCIDELERMPGDHSTAEARFRILLSRVLKDTGDLDRAERELSTALAAGSAEADPYARIRTHWSLARVSEEQGRYQAALRHARRALALLATTEDDVQHGLSRSDA
jgi:transcriptional regulator with XRE-family HTH domain